jgi:hypothetical protein
MASTLIEIPVKNKKKKYRFIKTPFINYSHCNTLAKKHNWLSQKSRKGVWVINTLKLAI